MFVIASIINYGIYSARYSTLVCDHSETNEQGIFFRFRCCLYKRNATCNWNNTKNDHEWIEIVIVLTFAFFGSSSYLAQPLLNYCSVGFCRFKLIGSNRIPIVRCCRFELIGSDRIRNPTDSNAIPSPGFRWFTYRNLSDPVNSDRFL